MTSLHSKQQNKIITNLINKERNKINTYVTPGIKREVQKIQPYVHYFSISYSTRLFPTDTLENFNFRVDPNFKMLHKGVKSQALRLIGHSIIRDNTYTPNEFRPIFVASNMLTQWISRYIAYLNSDVGQGEGNNTTVYTDISNNSNFNIRLYYDTEEKEPVFQAGSKITDIILRFQVITYMQ